MRTRSTSYGPLQLPAQPLPFPLQSCSTKALQAGWGWGCRKGKTSLRLCLRSFPHLSSPVLEPLEHPTLDRYLTVPQTLCPLNPSLFKGFPKMCQEKYFSIFQYQNASYKYGLYLYVLNFEGPKLTDGECRNPVTVLMLTWIFILTDFS